MLTCLSAPVEAVGIEPTSRSLPFGICACIACRPRLLKFAAGISIELLNQLHANRWITLHEWHILDSDVLANAAPVNAWRGE